MPKVLKCSKKAFCWALDMHLRASDDENAGMAPLIVTKITGPGTGTERLLGVGYRTKAHRKPFMFNFCPWCGRKILWMRKPKKSGTAKD